MIRAARIFAPTSSIRLALIDAAVVAAVFFALVRSGVFVSPSFFLSHGGSERLAALIAILILSMYVSGLYDRKRLGSRIFLFQQLSLCAGISLISQALIAWLYDPWTLPRNLALYGLLLCIFALFAWRMLREAILARFEGTGTLLILGTDLTAHRLARHIAGHPAQHLAVAGTLTNNPANAVPPVLGGLADLRAVAAALRPDLIVSGLTDSRDRMPVAAMVDLRYGGYRIEEAGAACELICRHISARDLRPSRMLFSSDFDVKDTPLPLLIADLAVAAILFLAGAPFALACAALLWVSGRKPVFTRETCVGFQGRHFVRRGLNLPDSGVPAALARGLHLEAWPDLWNVLLRRMSLVGPRPQLPVMAAELGKLLPVHEYRRNIRPGITGWAQVNLKGSDLLDAVREVEFDLYYIRNRSLSLYAYILLHGLREAV